VSNISTYILSWDCFGLESCINATAIEQERVFNILKDQPDTRNTNVGQLLTTLTLRARFNSQRHYEIYAVDVDESVDQQDLVEMFEVNPQGMADLIRKQGRKLYSDREDISKIKIV
jgi:hypothetical protein